MSREERYILNRRKKQMPLYKTLKELVNAHSNIIRGPASLSLLQRPVFNRNLILLEATLRIPLLVTLQMKPKPKFIHIKEKQIKLELYKAYNTLTKILPNQKWDLVLTANAITMKKIDKDYTFNLFFGYSFSI